MFLPNPFDIEKLNNPDLCVIILSDFYQNAKREYVDNLSIDDLADAALPYFSLDTEKNIKKIIKPLDLKAIADRKELDKVENGEHN